MTWLMSTAQGWRLVCAEPDFRRFSLVSFAVCVRSQLTFSAQAHTTSSGSMTSVCSSGVSTHGVADEHGAGLAIGMCMY
jgi:hypothetical protein